MRLLARPALDRRTLLRGSALGAKVALALPFLEAMRPRRAAAQLAPNRFVFFFKPNGMAGYRADAFGDPNRDKWTPKTSGASWQMSPILQPLADLRADITILSGIDSRWRNGAHDAQTTLLTLADPIAIESGVNRLTAGGRSMDLHIADKIGADTRFKTLELGCYLKQITAQKDGHLNQYLSFSAARTPQPPEANPIKLWDRLFSAGGVTDPQALDRVRRQRATVLDGVRENLAALSQKLGAQDRTRLDAHLTSVREIEARLTELALPSGFCQPPARPTPLAETPWNYEKTLRTMADIMTMALTCDLSRVATFMLGGGGNDNQYDHIGVRGQGEHAFTHSVAPDGMTAEAGAQKVDTWVHEQIAYVLRGLKDRQEPGGTLLDHTVFLVGSECASGWHHNEGGWTWGGQNVGKGGPLDLGFILAGGTRYFRHGKHLRYRGGMVFHDQLLRAVYEATTGIEGAASAAWMPQKAAGEVIPGVRGDSSSLLL